MIEYWSYCDLGSNEGVLGRVVSRAVEDIHPPILEDTEFFCHQEGHKPPE